MLKLGAALALLAVLGGLSWATLSEPRFRLVTLLVLGASAVKIWIEHRRRLMEGQGRE